MYRCPLCGDSGTMDGIRYHFGKIHAMDFKDNAEMKRRLAAVDIEVEEDIKVGESTPDYKPIIG